MWTLDWIEPAPFGLKHLSYGGCSTSPTRWAWLWTPLAHLRRKTNALGLGGDGIGCWAGDRGDDGGGGGGGAGGEDGGDRG